jgi:hypothetical protein
MTSWKDLPSPEGYAAFTAQDESVKFMDDNTPLKAKSGKSTMVLRTSWVALLALALFGATAVSVQFFLPNQSYSKDACTDTPSKVVSSCDSKKGVDTVAPAAEPPQKESEPAPAPSKPKRQTGDSENAFGLRDGIYDYIVIDQDLSVALLEFASHFKLQIEIDKEVRGRLRDRLPPSTGEEFLNQLAEENQFDWFFDGQVLRITPLRQTTTRIINTQTVEIKDLRAALGRLGISDRRHPLMVDELTGLIKLSGPPQFIAVVEATIDAMKKKKTSVVEAPDLRPALEDAPTIAPVVEPVVAPVVEPTVAPDSGEENVPPPKPTKSVIVHRGSETTEVQVE